jgi:hypothetical protein
MDLSVEALWAVPAAELLAAYHKIRRAYAEQKFARDTERGRLQWQRARAFVASKGGVTERMTAVDASDELAKKGQHVREMTRDLDLIKCDVDLVAAILRARGVDAFASPQTDDGAAGDTSGGEKSVAE